MEKQHLRHSDMEISVVLVTCNRPLEILMRAYNSVMCQTLKPKEFILVNAGGIEPPALEGCSVIQAPGSNGSKARNIGASNTTSEFIAFLDDDDEWLPEHLESHLSCFTENIGIVYSSRSDIGAWDLEEKDIMVRNWIGPTSFVSVSRRSFDEAGGFDESFICNQEWDLWIRLCRTTMAAGSGKVTAIKHDSSDSISGDTGKRISGWISLLTKYEEEYRRYPDVFARVTRVFRDEMHARHSIKGTIIAWKWCRKAKACMKTP